MAAKKSKRASSQKAASARQREIQADEKTRFDQNLAMDSDAKRQAREREDKMANAQRGLNQQAAEQIKEGDFARVDLDSVPDNAKQLKLQTYKNLQAQGAHGVSGQVLNVEMRAEGRFLRIDSPNYTFLVPEEAVVRADQRAKKSAAKQKRKAAAKRKRSQAKPA